MNLMVVGMNHKTAPVGIRERLSFRPKHIAEVNRLLKESASLDENLILSTCNRVEIYAVANRDKDHVKDIENFLSGFHGLNISDYKDRLYVHKDRAAIEHLFKVSAGLDSMVIGEMEILGQVKKAYQEARESRATGKVLNKLFENAFYTAKKVRTETFITRGAVSVSSAAVRLARKILGSLRDKKVLIIGAGKIGEQLVMYLREEGVESIFITNRTLEKTMGLAGRFVVTATPFEDYKSKLGETDIVITSTSAPHFILRKDDVSPLMPLRRQRPLLIIDLAVPRDVEPEVNEIDNVYLYDIDDLRKTIDEAIAFRKNELDSCFKIIGASSEKFIRWLVSEKARNAPR
jgi:glutamyl-tRNA reductase